MDALDLPATWPVPNAAAAIVTDDGIVGTVGDTSMVVRIASLAKPLTTWAALVAVEEGIISLETTTDDPRCTLRHLLSHAGGYGFDGKEPVGRPERRRTYSNGGIEVAADMIGSAADMPFGDYLRLAVFQPLGMTDTELIGSPAADVTSSVDDYARFVIEVRRPTLISDTTAAEATRIHFPDLSGIVPGVGRYERCTWGLGFEIRGDKSPHWTGARNDPSTYGHFGGAGTMFWIDPVASVSTIAFTDRPFDEWALRDWPLYSDAVIDQYGPPTAERPAEPPAEPPANGSS